jgi:hypothetical protein
MINQANALINGVEGSTLGDSDKKNWQHMVIHCAGFLSSISIGILSYLVLTKTSQHLYILECLWQESLCLQLMRFIN